MNKDELRIKNPVRNTIIREPGFIGRLLKILDNIDEWTISYKKTLNQIDHFRTICENIDSIIVLWLEYEPISNNDEMIQLKALLDEKVKLLNKNGINPILLSRQENLSDETIEGLKHYGVIFNEET